MPNLDSILVNGEMRYYAWVEPDAATPDPVPLLFALHGGGGNARIIASQLGYSAAELARPFFTIFPQGYGPTQQDGVWNSGHSTIGLAFGRDDVAFIDALLTEAEQRAASAGRQLDTTRVYAIGFSNGGMMAYRLAAELSSRFAAVGSISGAIGGDPDPGDPSRAVHINDPATHAAESVSVFHIHGLADTGTSFYGGPSQGANQTRTDVPTLDAMQMWAQHNGCHHMAISAHPDGVLRTWRGGRGCTDVQLLTLPGVGHAVPDSAMDLFTPFLLAHRK